jgi:S1-C subfamily serine protease
METYVLRKLEYIAVKITKFFFETNAKVALLLLLLFAPALMAVLLLNQSHPSSFTVMITNLSEDSGGSGSIITTSSKKSTILTNAHVCDVLNKDGGLVKKEDGSKYLVTGYRKSQVHDLCLVSVAADLGHSVKLASKAPDAYSDATITGHPALLPNVINKGSFGERKVIQILTGVKKCTERNVKTEEDAMFCAFFGVIPVITNFESITVSAMIMGGSSGSAVLDADGNLAGVVFAGQGKGLSYAFIVPYEYVATFLEEEVATNLPVTKVPLASAEEEAESLETVNFKSKMISKCNETAAKAHKVCNILRQDLIQ